MHTKRAFCQRCKVSIVARFNLRGYVVLSVLQLYVINTSFVSIEKFCFVLLRFLQDSNIIYCPSYPFNVFILAFIFYPRISLLIIIFRRIINFLETFLIMNLIISFLAFSLLYIKLFGGE